MSWDLRGAPGGYLGSPGGLFWGLGGLPGEPRRVIGTPWEVPGGLRGVPGAPRWGPWGGLGRFWGPLGRTASKKLLKSIGATVLEQKRVPKGPPRGSILGVKIYTKSHQKINAILVTFFRVPGHPPKRKSCIFNGVLFKIEGRPLLRQSGHEVDFGSHFGTPKDPKII